MTKNLIPNLAVVGALAINWLNTSHSNRLGHDHHCPLGQDAEVMAPGDPERCRCGWSTFYKAYLDITSQSVLA